MYIILDIEGHEVLNSFTAKAAQTEHQAWLAYARYLLTTDPSLREDYPTPEALAKEAKTWESLELRYSTEI